MNAEGVGLEGPHRRRTLIVPLAAASVAIGAFAADRVPPAVFRRRSRTRHVLPFGLRQKPVRLTGLRRKPRHVFLRVVPADLHHRTPPPAPAFVVHLFGIREPVVVLERDLVFRHRERPRNVHFVHRHLVPVAILAGNAAHREAARGNHDHFRTLPPGRQRIGEGAARPRPLPRERLLFGPHRRREKKRRGNGAKHVPRLLHVPLLVLPRCRPFFHRFAHQRNPAPCPAGAACSCYERKSLGSHPNGLLESETD